MSNKIYNNKLNEDFFDEISDEVSTEQESIDYKQYDYTMLIVIDSPIRHTSKKLAMKTYINMFNDYVNRLNFMTSKFRNKISKIKSYFISSKTTGNRIYDINEMTKNDFYNTSKCYLFFHLNYPMKYSDLFLLFKSLYTYYPIGEIKYYSIAFYKYTTDDIYDFLKEEYKVNTSKSLFTDYLANPTLKDFNSFEYLKFIYRLISPEDVSKFIKKSGFMNFYNYNRYMSDILDDLTFFNYKDDKIAKIIEPFDFSLNNVFSFYCFSINYNLPNIIIDEASKTVKKIDGYTRESYEHPIMNFSSDLIQNQILKFIKNYTGEISIGFHKPKQKVFYFIHKPLSVGTPDEPAYMMCAMSYDKKIMNQDFYDKVISPKLKI